MKEYNLSGWQTTEMDRLKINILAISGIIWSGKLTIDIGMLYFSVSDDQQKHQNGIFLNFNRNQYSEVSHKLRVSFRQSHDATNCKHQN